jgi:hypothetical protein
MIPQVEAKRGVAVISGQHFEARSGQDNLVITYDHSTSTTVYGKSRSVAVGQINVVVDC